MVQRRTTIAALALLAALAAMTAAPGAWAQEALKVAPPKLAITEHKLANGLRVVLHEDHSVPAANVQIFYSVGSKDERPGRSGFAHLFEHIMFKGSENLGPEEHKDLITSIGGRYNATTDFDRTLYFQTFPSEYLEQVLWMEADRLRSLNVSEENFKSERDVVKEERRLRVDNPPFGRLFEVVLKNTYTTHPYRILPIGSMEDLDAATIDDVREFHRAYYVPNNATLVVTGDFDGRQVMGWIEKYFGKIPAGPPPPRITPAEPAQTAERRAKDYDTNTPLPAVVMTFHVPEAGDPDLYPLQVAANVLSAGESSRLYRKMVHDTQMALAAGGQALVLDDPGVFFFFSILQAGKKPEDAEQAFLAEIDRLKSEPLSARELVKSKNQLISELVFGRQTVQDKGEAIAQAAGILEDPNKINTQLAEFQKVTAEDVLRVAKKYFTPENRTVVYMLPAAQKEAAQ